MKNQISPLKTLEGSNAFRNKSNLDVLRSLILFYAAAYLPASLLNSKFLHRIWQNFRPARKLMKSTAFAQFCGGETLLECQPVVSDLNRDHINSILDFSAESIQTEFEFDNNTQEVCKIIRQAAKDNRMSYAVFKPTSIVKVSLLEKKQSGQTLTEAEDLEFARAFKRFQVLCQEAQSNKIRLFIDAEESWIQDPIDQWVEEASALYNKQEIYIFNTLQMYRHDRLSYLQNTHLKAQKNGFKIGVKLVRGAYLEDENSRAAQLGKASPLYPNKEATDKAFDEAVSYCLHNHTEIAVCLGTHNIESVLAALELMKQLNIPFDSNQVHFAQLYGMSDPLSHYLASLKVNDSKYVPYGPIQKVMPYLMRRLQENKGVAGQINRELDWAKDEMKRRLGLG